MRRDQSITRAGARMPRPQWSNKEHSQSHRWDAPILGTSRRGVLSIVLETPRKSPNQPNPAEHSRHCGAELSPSGQGWYRGCWFKQGLPVSIGAVTFGGPVTLCGCFGGTLWSSCGAGAAVGFTFLMEGLQQGRCRGEAQDLVLLCGQGSIRRAGRCQPSPAGGLGFLLGPSGCSPSLPHAQPATLSLSQAIQAVLTGNFPSQLPWNPPPAPSSTGPVGAAPTALRAPTLPGAPHRWHCHPKQGTGSPRCPHSPGCHCRRGTAPRAHATAGAKLRHHGPHKHSFEKLIEKASGGSLILCINSILNPAPLRIRNSSCLRNPVLHTMHSRVLQPLSKQLSSVRKQTTPFNQYEKYQFSSKMKNTKNWAPLPSLAQIKSLMLTEGQETGRCCSSKEPQSKAQRTRTKLYKLNAKNIPKLQSPEMFPSPNTRCVATIQYRSRVKSHLKKEKLCFSPEAPKAQPTIDKALLCR